MNLFFLFSIFPFGAIRGAALGFIRLPDWTDACISALTRALLQMCAWQESRDLYCIVRPPAVIMEGSLLMIGVVTTLKSLFYFIVFFFPTVDKNKSKAGSHQQLPQQQASQQKQSNRPQDAVPASLTEADRINQNVQQLKGLLRASNCRFEALSIVLQQTLTGVRIDLFHKNTFICSLKYILWHTFC